MKPTSYFCYTSSPPLRWLPGTDDRYLMQWWEDEPDDAVKNKHGGEWRHVECEEFDGGAPPSGWKPTNGR